MPLKVKLRHMEKTIVGLMLATAANKARLDSTTQVLMENYRELSDLQRVCLRWLLGLKALLYSSCPALFARVFLFVNVIGMVGHLSHHYCKRMYCNEYRCADAHNTL